jgi:hypothetical protein
MNETAAAYGRGGSGESRLDRWLYTHPSASPEQVLANQQRLYRVEARLARWLSDHPLATPEEILKQRERIRHNLASSLIAPRTGARTDGARESFSWWRPKALPRGAPCINDLVAHRWYRPLSSPDEEAVRRIHADGHMPRYWRARRSSLRDNRPTYVDRFVAVLGGLMTSPNSWPGTIARC